MAEYCSKMTEHISKITERYFKMAYSKHKMTEYRGDGGLGMATHGVRGLVNAGSVHQSMRDENEAHTGAQVGGERASGDARGWLDRSIGWLV
jgi:hypothetical protein